MSFLSTELLKSKIQKNVKPYGVSSLSHPYFPQEVLGRIQG